MSKILLFDLDGVLTLPEEMFSVIYSRSRGYDLTPFTKFFETEWSEFVTGKKDLKQHIQDNPQFWKWDGDPEELLRYWFDLENIKNEPLLNLIQSMRKVGNKCYIATEQEQYRTNYLREVMFHEDLDGIFSTAEIGFKKKDPLFFQYVVEFLKTNPADIIFFDDSQSKLQAAASQGIQTHLYSSVDQVHEIIEKEL